MSATIVDTDVLVEQLLAVRRIVDEALRALGAGGTPPLPSPPARSAEHFLGSPAPKPGEHEHQWVAAGFGSLIKTCSTCGAKG